MRLAESLTLSPSLWTLSLLNYLVQSQYESFCLVLLYLIVFACSLLEEWLLGRGKV